MSSRGVPEGRPPAKAKPCGRAAHGLDGRPSALGFRRAIMSAPKSPANTPGIHHLLDTGARSLSDAELMSVFCRNGRSESAALSLARRLLEEHGGLTGLVESGLEGQRSMGVGEATWAALLAARELAYRLAEARQDDRCPLRRPVDTARYLALRYHLRDQEVLGVLFLDGQHRLLAHREIFRGTFSRIAVEPREILKQALVRGAAALVLFHTHPSGDPAPSPEDLAFTRRMAISCEMVGILLVDHFILGGGDRWASLKELGVY
jgi:DNA repair protein RadC